MTSTSIYTPITPTYLYIKQHSITKKKYFGKTTNLDPYTYNGSGVYWSRHINKHGKEHIVTLWVSGLYYDTSIVEVALKFSVDNDIVKSKEWANMEPENGLNGAAPGRKCSEETKAKQSAVQTGKKHKPHKQHKPRSDKGKPKSEEHKANMRKPRSEEAKVNMRKSEETKANMRTPKPEGFGAKVSAAQTGKKHKPHKQHKDKGEAQKQVTCHHCGKTGGENVMKRWHFDKCKILQFTDTQHL